MTAGNEQRLLPYAACAAQSRGRSHDEPDDPLRDAFEVDRYRVYNSAAFRRLEYKTQAFVTLEDDHFRTRLTHTLEVAGIARTLAVQLGANEALAEVIGLAHDLGHPPFGHAGEAALRALMADWGGFEHNTHSLRVVDYLEHPYPKFRGLNLSYETREGLVKHATRYDNPAAALRQDPRLWDLIESGPLPGVEAQIASLADRLAYDCHDLEDAIAAGLIGERDVSTVELWRQAAATVPAEGTSSSLAAVRRPVIDALLNTVLQDVVAESRRKIAQLNPRLIDDVRVAEQPVVAVTAEVEGRLNELEAFLSERVYRHHRLVRMDAKARRFLERLFAAYVGNPSMLPPRFARRIDEQGVYRVVCDYIAGMTDRFCQDDYRRLFEPFERV